MVQQLLLKKGKGGKKKKGGNAFGQGWIPQRAATRKTTATARQLPERGGEKAAGLTKEGFPGLPRQEERPQVQWSRREKKRKKPTDIAGSPRLSPKNKGHA